MFPLNQGVLKVGGWQNTLRPLQLTDAWGPLSVAPICSVFGVARTLETSRSTSSDSNGQPTQNRRPYPGNHCQLTHAL